MAESQPLILYVPGLKPKPEPEVHHRQLFRCLLAGIQNIDVDVASYLERHSHCFDLVSWTYDFYGEHRDNELDLPGIDALLSQPDASPGDKAEAASFKRREPTPQRASLGDRLTTPRREKKMSLTFV